MATKADDIKQSEEWQKAVSYEIRDEDIERQKQLIGFEEPGKMAQYVQTLSHDSIRNWSYGCGDDNPLFTDPNYARRTRWGDAIAPGMMIGQVGKPLLGDPTPDEIRALKKSLFRGIHVFVSGADWEFYRAAYPGDTIYTFSGRGKLRGQAVRIRGPVGDQRAPPRQHEPARRCRVGLSRAQRADRTQDRGEKGQILRH